jgi:hypothetical protein
MRIPKTAVIGAMLMAVSSWSSADVIWNFGGSACVQSGSGFTNSWTCTASAGSPSVTVTGWSTTGTSATLAAANVPRYSLDGFGVRNQVEGLAATSPNHSMDNKSTIDMLLFAFGKAVDLSSVTIGWKSGDADISVLAYEGASAPTVAGASVGSLVSGDWRLIGHYANLGEEITRQINSTDYSSQWWLVSSYSAGYGGNPLSDGVKTAYDYVKVLSVAGVEVIPVEATPVPAPGSLALMGLGILAVAMARRRRR